MEESISAWICCRKSQWICQLFSEGIKRKQGNKVSTQLSTTVSQTVCHLESKYVSESVTESVSMYDNFVESVNERVGRYLKG